MAPMSLMDRYLKRHVNYKNNFSIDEDLPIFPVEHQLVSVLRKRLNLAKKIDTEEHR